MRVDLRLQKGEFGIQFLRGNFFIALLGFQPLVNDLNAGAEYKDQEENGDIPRRQDGLLEIAGPSGRRRAHARRQRLKAAEKIMIDPGKTTVKDQEGQDNERIGNKFLLFQQPGNDQIGIEIVKGYEKDTIYDEKNREVPLNGEVFRPGKKYKRQQEETNPCRQMNDDLYDSLLQVY